jgi:chemotaxis protein MotB
MKIFNLLLTITLLMATISSCVPKKNLRKSQARVGVLVSDSTKTHKNLNECNAELSKARMGSSRQLNTIDSLANDLLNLANASYNEISQSKLTIADQAKRLNDLQSLITNQKNVMNKLKKTITDALVNFKPDELTVAIKDGKIYVSLQEKLLFKSGSDLVDPKGKEALKTLATVLNSNRDIQVLIEGHTDSVAISGKFADNWALSVSRATSIVRVLSNDYKIEAKRITASGRGEYYPIQSNATVDGRAKNRRTEIILSPDLTELFKIINN